MLESVGNRTSFIQCNLIDVYTGLAAEFYWQQYESTKRSQDLSLCGIPKCVVTESIGNGAIERMMFSRYIDS